MTLGSPSRRNSYAPSGPSWQRRVDPSHQRHIASEPVPSAATIPAQGTPSALSFKATVLDENSNLVFEGGERIRVRIDLVNGGEQELQGVTAALTGTASLLAQFPTTTLAVGRLQPGQSRSIEFVATVPQSVQQQKAEIHVAVSDSETRTQPPTQTLALSIQPTGIKADDVDQIPAVVTGFRQPHTYLISIGIGSYRDQQVPSRKFASMDAQMVSSYFQSLGGLPASNIHLLQDWKAIRSDIDEALLDWLPPHMNKDAVVIVYFAGLASVSSTGETFLVPYDGTATTTSRAYPLKDLEAALSRLKAKQTVFLFDGIVSPMGPDSRTKTPYRSPNGIPQEARPSMSSEPAASGRGWRTTNIGMACSPTICCGHCAVRPIPTGMAT